MRRRLVALAVLMVALLLSPLGARVGAEPPPRDRTQWVAGIDDLYPREGGKHLSRRTPRQLLAEIPLPDASYGLRFEHYATAAEIGAFLARLEAEYPSLAQLMTVGRSWGGRPIYAIRLGNEMSGDPDARPALYLDGQHHAREAIGAQVVLYFLWHLLSRYGADPLITHLLDTRTVYAIPCVNPDGGDIFVSSDQRQRKTANPQATDEDGDGRYDEDGREGAGYGSYEVYRYFFDAAWAESHAENPLVDNWGQHLRGHVFIGLFDGAGHLLPQSDEDGDGLLGEDPPGGVDPNRNYDSHWVLGSSNPRADSYRGPTPFSEPETAAVRDFVRARPNIATALSYHSGTDMLLHPWGWSASSELPERFWYELLSRKGSALTEANGLVGTPHGWTARGLYVVTGATLDWLYEQGILAWTPEVYGASTLAAVTRITTTNAFTVALSMGEAFNPLPDEIPLSVDRWRRWNLYLLAATPNVGLSDMQIQDGALHLWIANDGLLPLEATATVTATCGITRTVMPALSAAQRLWAIPLCPDAPSQTLTITLAAELAIGGEVRRLEEQSLVVAVTPRKVRLLEGHLEPYEELGSAFGGWFAGREWDSPRYHLGEPLLREQFFPLMLQGPLPNAGEE